MKKSLLSAGLVLALVASAHAQAVNWYSGTIGMTLADNSPAGATFDTTGGIWSSSPSGLIDSVSVVLNISGGYNGDLFGYLVYNDGSDTRTEILLNRIGGGSNSASGSGLGTGGTTTDFVTLRSAGVTLTDGVANGIHGVSPGTGLSVAAGSSYTPDSTRTLNETFRNMKAGGTWTLFMGDMAAGDQSALVSWGVETTAVPEPATWSLLVIGVGLQVVVTGRKKRARPLTA